MQKQLIFFLFSLIYIVNGDGNNNYQYSNCKRFENKVYQLNVTYPDKTTFYTSLRLLPNGLFDEISSIANGNNLAELGTNFAFSNSNGYYKCLRKNDLRLTAFGYVYETPSVSYLSDNGAVIIYDYYFNFYNNDKTFTGSVKYAIFKSGTNPFTTTDKPVSEGDIGTVQGQLLKFKKYYDLSDTTVYQ
jgi:hypothetical protein